MLALAVASGVAGCGSLKVTKISATAQAPANVAMLLDVRDDDGKGVGGLEAGNFKVYEDGKLMPPAKAKRAVLEARGNSVHYTLVLLDLSGPAADSEDLPEIATAVKRLVEKLDGKQEVAVSVFDGEDEIAPFLGFGAGAKQAQGLVEGIRKFRPRKRNTNWNGAVYQGLHVLETQLAESKVADKKATLVLFTDRGNDLSHAVGIDVMRNKVKSSPVKIFVIGAGAGINKPELTLVGRDGAFLSTDPKGYKKGFDEIGQKLAAATDGRYLFSYCSPKRRGDHKVEVEVAAAPGKGRVAYKFSADGFKGGCSAKRPPSFDGEGEPADAEATGDGDSAGDGDGDGEGADDGEDRRPRKKRATKSAPPPAETAAASDE